MKRLFLVCLALLLGVLNAVAQDRTVTGRVTDKANGEALPGVTILVKGTSIGTTSGGDGSFSISAPASATTLVFSFIGYGTMEQSITDAPMNVGLMTDTKQLGEVVVTALGREEQKRTLGYAVQDLNGGEITQARETNFVNSLQGRIAGVQITNSGGAPGSSSRIVIRGAKSVTGNNQPLFVINGQPIDNSSFSNTTSSAGNGIDYGNAASDINPDDIESLTVLKGANATALYGSRGANGVIVITTKSGRKARGLGLSINSTTSFESALIVPKLQHEYGQGSGGEFEYVDGAGGGTNDGIDESWGPKLDGRLIPQYNSPVVNGVRQATPWISPGKDNVKKFFQNARTLTNNVAISGGNDRAGMRFSYTNLDQTGLLPNTYLKRNTVNVDGGVDVTDKFKVNTTINYTQTQGRRPGLGYDELNVMQQLYTWYGRQVNVEDLKSLYDRTHSNANWNSNYHNNPYYVLNECTNDDRRDRVIGNLTLSYKATQWLTLTGRVTNDFYNQLNTRRVGAETISNSTYDDYTEEKIYVQERNYEFLASAVKNLGENFSIDGLIGTNRRDNRQEMSTIAAPNLAVPGLYTLGNASSPLVANGNFSTTANANNVAILNPIQQLRVNSIYASAKLGYRNFAFLGVTGRNDWSSTLPSNSLSFFYPSVDASIVLTEALGLKESFLSFAKIRGGYAEGGNGTDPYRLRNIFTGGQPFGTYPTQTLYNVEYNPNLKPERTKSTEAGIEVRFLQNRIGLDVTLYKTNTIDQIINVPVSASTGFTSKYLNAGKMSNRGVEAILTVSPLAPTSAFQWNLTANFAANRNRLEEFDKEGKIRNLILGRGAFNVNVEARVGETYGVLFGNDFQRVPDGQYKGQIIYDEDGFPLVDATRKSLGSYVPDWVGGITNQFSYKGISLSVTIDTRRGGKIYSETNRFGNYSGALESTLKGREDGIIGEGVIQNPDGTYRPNDVRISAQEYNEAYYDVTNTISSIYDASFTKLREIRVGYQLPKSLVERTFLKGIGVSFVGRNLFLLESKAPNIDPETSFNNGNVQGLESTQLPPTRSLGFNVNLTL